MKKTPLLQFLCVLVSTSGLAGAAGVYNVNQTFSSNPSGDDYLYNTVRTWDVSGNITVGNGTGNYGRFFVGVDGGNGTLTLQGNLADGADTLTLNGYHSADPIIGRLGHTAAGNVLGTLNIDGGLAVIMGSHMMKYTGTPGGTNFVNILNGSLNYTTAGFGWWEEGSSALVSHVIGANGSLIVPGNITDAAGFANWAVTSGNGVELNDVTVAAASGLSLQFVSGGGMTTITAVPEPAVALLGVFGAFGLLRRRRN